MNHNGLVLTFQLGVGYISDRHPDTLGDLFVREFVKNAIA